VTPRLLACCALAAASVQCGGQPTRRGYEYMPNMTYAVSYHSFAPNPATRNGRTLQDPVRGTIPRGFTPMHYDGSAEDAARAGRELSNPHANDPAAAVRGRGLYETFCLVCHGARGEGDGPIVPLIPNPPAYTSARVRAMPAGQLFHVITFGSGRMPSYRSQVPADDRWLIVSYVQTLQTLEPVR
jgi:mono/diheme cytochrome c family protein